jgi:uncharacterized protein (TIGR03435 family)
MAGGYYRPVVHAKRTMIRDEKTTRMILRGIAYLLASLIPTTPMAFSLRAAAQASPSAQSASEVVSFSVASIRLSSAQSAAGEGSSRSQVESAPDGLRMRNVDLGEMLQWAYRLDPDQIQGADALPGRRYDVSAKTDNPVPEATLRRMLQDLLATRFKLQAHEEQRMRLVYELVVAKSGPRLPANVANSLPPAHTRESLPRVVDGNFVFHTISMDDFARQLAELRGIDRPVVNRTGIQGVYDITLKSAAQAILEGNSITLPAMIEQQLGLRLNSGKEPMRALVIDRVEEPSSN